METFASIPGVFRAARRRRRPRPQKARWGVWSPLHGWARDKSGRAVTYDDIDHARHAWLIRVAPTISRPDCAGWRVREVPA